ncbi:BLUF domain-containing protein [Dongshaea marina]|uniref:BLUF domain-containing protein n=1 Tax=Dongshaea marina TaxID=2047966 RepID=UPI000D3E1697|nr:BLUF domain-containing protein [Dongshaea marina]
MYRLIYKSSSVAPITWELVREIMRASKERNKQEGITGALLATEKHFLQVIEGNFESVNRLFMRIVKDPRHDEIHLIAFHTIDARLFEHWGMRGIGVFDLDEKLDRQLKSKYGEDYGELHFPLEEWMVLSLFHDIEMDDELPEWKR